MKTAAVQVAVPVKTTEVELAYPVKIVDSQEADLAQEYLIKCKEYGLSASSVYEHKEHKREEMSNQKLNTYYRVL